VATLNINGKPIDLKSRCDTPLLWALREQAGLTGTKYGCGIAQCGACSVHINGEVQRSCAILVKDVKPGDKIVTIEGLARKRRPSGAKGLGSARRAAMRILPNGPDHGRLGTPQKKPKPTDADIDEAMTNICRCGTYSRIRAAIHQAAGTSAASIGGNKA